MNKQNYLYTEGGGFRPRVVANPEDVEIKYNQIRHKVQQLTG